MGAWPLQSNSVVRFQMKLLMQAPLKFSWFCRYIYLALGGGFTTNFVYSVIFSVRNKSFGDYNIRPKKTLFRNYFMALLSGLMWYGQFFFYGMGTTKMGHFDFASWSIHMASIIIFSNLWGLWLKEWKLVSRKALTYLLTGIIMLIVSVILIGIGNYMAGIG